MGYLYLFLPFYTYLLTYLFTQFDVKWRSDKSTAFMTQWRDAQDNHPAARNDRDFNLLDTDL